MSHEPRLGTRRSRSSYDGRVFESAVRVRQQIRDLAVVIRRPRSPRFPLVAQDLGAG